MSRQATGPGRLEVTDARACYDRTEVLHGVSIHAEPGECVAIVGRNGAGKSTLLNAIAGSVRLTRGSIRLGESDITRLKPHLRVRRGLGSTMQGHRVFQMQTVLDNLQIAGQGVGRKRSEVSPDIDRVYELFPILAERSGQKASTLSGGQQQMLAIAQTLMTRPSVLLLDEPSAGLAPLLVAELFRSLTRLTVENDLTILIVEQVVSDVLRIANRGYVLNLGEITLEGSSSELATNPEVLDTYIGRTTSATIKGEPNG